MRSCCIKENTGKALNTEGKPHGEESFFKTKKGGGEFKDLLLSMSKNSSLLENKDTGCH